MDSTTEPDSQYPAKFAVVGTEVQGALLDLTNEILGWNSKARIVRAGLNALFGLTAEGELREGDTMEDVAQRAADRLRPVPVDPATFVAP